MNQIDDKGFIREVDLIKEFYQTEKAQLTDKPSVEISDGKVSVSCETQDRELVTDTRLKKHLI